MDLGQSVSYQRYEFPVMNDTNYYELSEAIESAKGLADRHQLRYNAFESLYDSDLNEKTFIH